MPVNISSSESWRAIRSPPRPRKKFSGGAADPDRAEQQHGGTGRNAVILSVRHEMDDTNTPNEQIRHARYS